MRVLIPSFLGVFTLQVQCSSEMHILVSSIRMKVRVLRACFAVCSQQSNGRPQTPTLGLRTYNEKTKHGHMRIQNRSHLLDQVYKVKRKKKCWYSTHQFMIKLAVMRSFASLSLGVMEHPKGPGELFFFVSSGHPTMQQRFSSATQRKKGDRRHSRDEPVDVLVRFGRGLVFGPGQVKNGQHRRDEDEERRIDKVPPWAYALAYAKGERDHRWVVDARPSSVCRRAILVVAVAAGGGGSGCA